MGCVRLDSLTLEDMQRLAGRPHDYPTTPNHCPGCNTPIAASATYCTVECGAAYRKRAQFKFGRAALSTREEGMETSAHYSYPPPR